MRPLARVRRAGATILGLAALLTLVAPLEAQRRPSEFPRELLHGREITFESRGLEWKGELLAVSADTLWVENGGVASAHPLGSVIEPTVRRHEFGMRRVLAWSALVGGVSGVALTGACSSVEGTSCEGVLPVTLGGWLLTGALLGAVLEGTSKRELMPQRDLLRPYARFPQGLPDAYPRAAHVPVAGGGAS